MDERTESCLRALQASAVENVLTQTVAVLDRDSLYRSSGLIVQCGQSAYSIGADSLVSEQLDELFFVCASVHVQWPHARPAPAPIGPQADRLSLKGIIGTAPQISIVRWAATVATADGAELRGDADAGLLLTGLNGAQLLIDCRCNPFDDLRPPVMPLDLVLTTDAQAILELLDQATVRPVGGSGAVNQID